MNNKQLADTFTLIADLLEIKGEVIYVTLAYRKAAESLVTISRDASDYWKEGKLREIPGVGKAIGIEDSIHGSHAWGMGENHRVESIWSRGRKRPESLASDCSQTRTGA